MFLGMPLPVMRVKRKETSQSLPAMTSNTAPAGHEAFASTNFGAPFEAYKAFDQVIDAQSQWIGGQFQVISVFIGRKTPMPITVWKYRINFNSLTQRAPRSFKLQGSSDGASYADLDSRTGETGWPDQVPTWREYEVASPAPFAYHRLFVSANNGATDYASICELELLQVL